jgi:hypothetical protein
VGCTFPEAVLKTSPMTSRSPRARRVLVVLLGTALVVSVVHYTDNVVNYADYPQPEPSGPPAPSAPLIGAAWFMFTAVGPLGLGLFVRGRIVTSAWALTGYAVSGLIGVGHYMVPGATAMPWRRQAHVLADIICGVLILGFAVWSVVTRRPAAASKYERDQAVHDI